MNPRLLMLRPTGQVTGAAFPILSYTNHIRFSGSRLSECAAKIGEFHTKTPTAQLERKV